MTDTHSAVASYTSGYPDWARELARKYLTKTLMQFIVYGNVRDLVPVQYPNGESDYVPLRTFLEQELFAKRNTVLFYDRSAGIHFANRESQEDFYRALSGYDSFYDSKYAQKLPRDTVRVFSILENYFRMRLGDGRRIACVVDYAETIVPMAETSTYSAEDRSTLVFLQKWAQDPLFLSRDFTLCLIAENLTDLNQQLVQSPYTVAIRIPMPEEQDRLAFARWHVRGREPLFDSHAEVSLGAIAHNTAGLGFTQVRTILADVLENRARLTFETLSATKKDFIEAEAHGMLEFVETDFNLDTVAGHREAKEHLRQASRALKARRTDVVPMGYLISGPVGTGKTFLITCFAGEIGIPMVKLKNFRSQWQGVTERNLEKILYLLEAMTPVAVMIDEADAALGDRDAAGDSGVSGRVFAQIASFMSDPSHRGRILFFLVTARPDLMPVDLKRQGRAEEHLALFYPDTREEREELLRVMMKRTELELDMASIPEALLDGSRTFSGADMEAIFTRTKFRLAAWEGATPPMDESKAGSAIEAKVGTETQDHARAASPTNEVHATEPTPVDHALTKQMLAEVVDDLIPPTYPEEVELQTLAAVLECTSRALLPRKYRDEDREQIVERVRHLKRLA